MIVLDASTKLLKVLLGGAAATTELPITVNTKRYPSERPLASQTITTGGTAVTIATGVDSPDSLVVEEFTVYNADTANADVTVRLTDVSTTRILFKATLAPGDSLNYGPTGFKVVNSSGILKTTTAAVTGRLLRAPQVLTSGTDYDPPAGCTAIRVTAYGAGGGGGGCDTAASNGGAGGGGGAGAKVVKYYANPPQNCVYAIGAAGTAGSSAAGTGGTGGDTTFTDGVTLITAKGGLGGVGMANGTSNILAAGGLGVVGTNGDVNGKGEAGNHGHRVSGTVGGSGKGGSTDVAAGGGGLVAAAAGIAGTVGGGGGGGALVLNNSAAVAGGAGGAGMIIIEEFS